MIPQSEILKRKKEAKKYLNQVIDQMVKADSDIKNIIRQTLYHLVNTSMHYSCLGKGFHFSANPELEKRVDKIFDKLLSDIFNIIYLRSENVDIIAHQKEKAQRNNKYLHIFLASQIAGLTLDDRIYKYVDMLRSEIEAYIAVGLANGYTQSQIINLYIIWLKNPYACPQILKAFNTKGYKAERIKNKGITFGKGKYISSFNNLLRLEQQTIFQAYNHTINSIWLSNRNIVGWYTIRGSAYPCSICDDNIGVFHPKDEFFYGYHIRCCCIMLPIFLTDVRT